MKLSRFAAAFAAAALAAAPAFAAFDDTTFGARDAAMGGAFTAVHDEVGAIAYNPAALGQAPALEAAAAYVNGTHPAAGTIDRDTTRAAVALPIRQEIFNGAFGFGVRYDRRANISKDREIAVYYGTRGLKETEGGGLDFGAGLKTMQSSLETGGSTKTKIALDLGTLWRLSDRGAVGASLLNFGGAKFAGPGGYSDRAPLALKIGGEESVHGALMAVDGTIREGSSGQRGSETFALGFERWWPTVRSGSFAGRTGLSVGTISNVWSWGFGWRLGGGRVDYSMGVPLTGVTRFTHGLTLAIRFGRSDPEAEYEGLLQGEMRARQSLGRSLDASAVRQQALSEEIGRLRDEIAALRASLAEKTSTAEEARRKLKDLEVRHQKAVDTFQRLQDEHARNAAKTKGELFREDWDSYEKSKLDGAPDAALLERVQRLLVEYKDSGVDLGEANQELRHLQQSR